MIGQLTGTLIECALELAEIGKPGVLTLNFVEDIGDGRSFLDLPVSQK